MPGNEAMLSAELKARFPGLQVEVFSPSMRFDPNGIEGHEALHRIALSQPAIVFICLGMPKQENWAIQHRAKVSASLVMCVGAAMEFALGQKRRAPMWMQRNGLEWVWRLASEPRRLWRRYLVESLAFARLLWRERAVHARRGTNPNSL
jgi:N-acetylglucosaminyldiphosphoundecaprenol N-acetyl-beta-D-mannosaminyltransferase